MTVETRRPQVEGTDLESAGGRTLNALSFRIRAAVLWVAVAVAATGSLLLYMFVPGALEELLAGEMEGETLGDAMGFFFAVLAAFPLAMAVASLLVGERTNPYMNLIAGLALGLFGAYAVFGHISAGDFNGHVLLAGLAGALGLLIAALGLIGIRQTDRPSPRT